MRRLIRFLVGSGVALLLLLALALWAAIDARPAVERDDYIDPRLIAEGKRRFDANDPRWLRPGEQGSLALPVPVIDTAAHHLARIGLRGKARVSVDDGLIRLAISRAIPATPWFLNIHIAVRPGQGEPRLDSVRIGALPLPAALGEYLLQAAADRGGIGQQWRLGRQAIGAVRLDSTGSQVEIDYTWRPELLRQAGAIALPPADVARMKLAHERLARLLAQAPHDKPLYLRDLLPALLVDLGDNSPAQMRDTLLVLGAYLAEKNLANLTPEARRWPALRNVDIVLRDRHDTAQHFTVSATLAAWAGEPVADAVGLWKEIDDIRHSSGFSFADLAADRAGTRFGALLAEQPALLRQKLRNPPGRTLADGDFIPRIDDLPEYLSDEAIHRQFGSADRSSPHFVAMQQNIEARLQQLPFYR